VTDGAAAAPRRRRGAQALELVRHLLCDPGGREAARPRCQLARRYAQRRALTTMPVPRSGAPSSGDSLLKGCGERSRLLPWAARFGGGTLVANRQKGFGE